MAQQERCKVATYVREMDGLARQEKWEAKQERWFAKLQRWVSTYFYAIKIDGCLSKRVGRYAMQER